MIASSPRRSFSILCMLIEKLAGDKASILSKAHQTWNLCMKFTVDTATFCECIEDLAAVGPN